MSVKALKELFAQFAAAGYSCTSATLAYIREHDREMQIIKFSGMTPEGGSFDLTSEPMDPNTPLPAAVEKIVAQMPKEVVP